MEALKGSRVIDVACGSGDAQTLCVTDDGDVWSWGDGDYGKLGRGGSDGCKVPIRVDSLHGMAVVKVECGSQFSVALTKSGAVYTWQVFICIIVLLIMYHCTVQFICSFVLQVSSKKKQTTKFKSDVSTFKFIGPFDSVAAAIE